MEITDMTEAKLMGVGIVLGLFVWGLVGALTGECVVHKADAGVFPGLIAGIWAAWPFFHQGRVQRYNFLHPVPRRYKLPLKQAFCKGEADYQREDLQLWR